MQDSVVVSWSGFTEKSLQLPAVVKLQRNPVYVPPSTRSSELFDQYETGPSLTVVDSYTEVNPRASESYGFGRNSNQGVSSPDESYGFVSESLMALSASNKASAPSAAAAAAPKVAATAESPYGFSEAQYVEPVFVPMAPKTKEKKRWTPPAPLAQDQPQNSPTKKVFFFRFSCHQN